MGLPVIYPDTEPLPNPLLTEEERFIAFEYPYDRPKGSFVLDANTGKYVECEITAEDIEGRSPVLAIGSNAAPQALAGKLNRPEGQAGYRESIEPVVPVTAVTLRGHDVAFGATIFNGYVPATLVESPGTEVEIHITWLTPEQLAVIHETEDLEELYALTHEGENSDTKDSIYPTEPPLDSYKLVKIFSDNIVAPAGIGLPKFVEAYVTSTGFLQIDRQPFVYSSFRRRGRSFPEGSESDVLTWLGEGFGLSPERFVAKTLRDEGFFAEVQAWMNEWGSSPVKRIDPAEL